MSAAVRCKKFRHTARGQSSVIYVPDPNGKTCGTGKMRGNEIFCTAPPHLNPYNTHSYAVTQPFAFVWNGVTVPEHVGCCTTGHEGVPEEFGVEGLVVEFAPGSGMEHW